MDRKLAGIDDSLSRAREDLSHLVRQWALLGRDPSITHERRARLAAELEAAQLNLARLEEQRDEYLTTNPSVYGSLSSWGLVGDSRLLDSCAPEGPAPVLRGASWH